MPDSGLETVIVTFATSTPFVEALAGFMASRKLPEKLSTLSTQNGQLVMRCSSEGEGERNMAQLVFSQALTANQLNFNPISAVGWQFEFLPWPATIVVIVRSTDAAERMTIYAGSETIQQKSPVASGGTIGQTPTHFVVPPVTFRALARDRLIISIDNTGAGTPTVDGVVIVEPLT